MAYEDLPAMSRRPALVALLLSAALSTRAAADEPLREQSVAIVEAGGLRSIQIENSRGRIELHPSADSRIHLSALKVVRADKAHQREIADAITVEAGASDGVYRIKVRYPQRREVRIGLRELFEGVEIPSAEVRLTLDVPARLEVAVNSTSGDVTSLQLDNPQTLQSTSGDIEVDALGPVQITTTSGDVESAHLARARIRTASGDVEIQHAGGPLAVHTTSGQLVVRDAADSLSLGSVSGDIQVGRAPRGINAGSASGNIQVREAAGRVFIESSSGDVDVALTRGVSRAEVVSGSGDIDASVAPGLELALEMRTSNGALYSDLGIDVQSANRRLLTGRMGSGSAPVVLRSSSGDIKVQKSGGN
jgi:hypothetical protein